MDAVDHQIVRILLENARLPISEIARAVGLSAAPVSRRIERLERDKVIRGYTVVLDDSLVGGLDAFTEIRLQGATETGELERLAQDIPEVRQLFTIAGDPDALVRFRVDNVDHLQHVVNSIRSTGKVAGTKTLIVLREWSRPR